MQDIELLNQRSETDLAALLRVWESAVRATHDFLSEEDIQNLIPLVAAGLAQVPQLAVLRSPGGAALGFAGVDDTKLEMLFVEAGQRGRGIGRCLAEFAIRRLGVRQVDVNEQNPQGLGFYLHLGFRQYARSDLDGQGNPFPILHLKL